MSCCARKGKIAFGICRAQNVIKFPTASLKQILLLIGGNKLPTIKPSFGLIVYPTVCFFHSVDQLYRWTPAENLMNKRIVAVTTTHACRSVPLISSFETNTGDLLNDIDQLVYADHFLAADI